MTARVSMLLKSRASPDVLPFVLCNKKKTCNSAREQTPLSDTIDSVLQHRDLGRAKDLSAPPRVFQIYEKDMEIPFHCHGLDRILCCLCTLCICFL